MTIIKRKFHKAKMRLIKILLVVDKTENFGFYLRFPSYIFVSSPFIFGSFRRLVARVSRFVSP